MCGGMPVVYQDYLSGIPNPPLEFVVNRIQLSSLSLLMHSGLSKNKLKSIQIQPQYGVSIFAHSKICSYC